MRKIRSKNNVQNRQILENDWAGPIFVNERIEKSTYPNSNRLLPLSKHITLNCQYLFSRLQGRRGSKSVHRTAGQLGTRIVLRMHVLDEELEKMHREEEQDTSVYGKMVSRGQ